MDDRSLEDTHAKKLSESYKIEMDLNICATKFAKISKIRKIEATSFLSAFTLRAL